MVDHFPGLSESDLNMKRKLVMEPINKCVYYILPRPENVPRLYDLVHVKDNQIRTAFFFALRNTLVADDLKQATNIAFQVKLFLCMFIGPYFTMRML